MSISAPYFKNENNTKYIDSEQEEEEEEERGLSLYFV